MTLSCGIVGLPNVGKSTLFNCLSTSAKAQAANYPFCTIEPNVGIVSVPDIRLDKLAEIVNPEKIVPAYMSFVDIAGLVRGASKGEGLGNQFLSHIREVDAVCHVVRCFADDNIVHVEGAPDPVRDIGIIETELILKDYESVTKQLDKVQRLAKSGNAQAKKQFDFYSALQKHLDNGLVARTFSFNDSDEDLFIAYRDLHLLTAKPCLFVANVSENQMDEAKNPYLLALKDFANKRAEQVVVVCAKIEEELTDLSGEERKEFLADLGLESSGLEKVIKAAFKLLKLKTYLTAGKTEVRAWTIKEGFTAPQAAGVIHTDFEKGFIKADVIWWEDFVRLKGEAGCKQAGLTRLEGKEYIVKDGDIMHFKFNV